MVGIAGEIVRGIEDGSGTGIASRLPVGLTAGLLPHWALPTTTPTIGTVRGIEIAGSVLLVTIATLTIVAGGMDTAVRLDTAVSRITTGNGITGHRDTKAASEATVMGRPAQPVHLTTATLSLPRLTISLRPAGSRAAVAAMVQRIGQDPAAAAAAVVATRIESIAVTVLRIGDRHLFLHQMDLDWEEDEREKKTAFIFCPVFL